MSYYTGNNPQANIPIFQYLQNLGYKYKQYISHFNQFEEDTYPSTKNEEGETVPNLVLPNQPIQAIGEDYLIWTPDSGYQPATRARCPFEWVEYLLAKAVLESLDYSINTINEPTEVFEYDAYGKHYVITTEKWYKTLSIDTSPYDFCRASTSALPGSNGITYPYILELDLEQSRYRTFTTDETIAELNETSLQSDLEGGIAFRQLPRLQGYREVETTQVYDDGELEAEYSSITEWDYVWWLKARFLVGEYGSGQQKYNVNQNLFDRRINILKDIDAKVDELSSD